MLTKNFKKVMSMILESTGSPDSSSPNPPTNTVGILPIRAIDGGVFYIAGQKGYYNSGARPGAFPAVVYRTVSFSRSGYGIFLGKSDIPATEDDWCLRDMITSGLTATTLLIQHNIDENNNLYIMYRISLTNTSNDSITIKEIGYSQPVTGSTVQWETTSTTRYCLLDRTVLETPVTIAPSETGVIEYTLSTNINYDTSVEPFSSNNPFIYYNFKESINDNVRGIPLTYNVRAEQSENGIIIQDVSSYIEPTLSDISTNNCKTIEIKFGDIQVQTSGNSRFIMQDNGSGSNSGRGLVYSNSQGKWGYYNGSWEYFNVTDRDIFNNKVVKLVLEDSDYLSVYADNILVFTTTRAWSTWTYGLYFGCGSQGTPMTIEYIKIY